MNYKVSYCTKVGGQVVEVERMAEASGQALAIARATAQYYDEQMSGETDSSRHDLTQAFEVLVTIPDFPYDSDEEDAARSEQLCRDHADELGHLR